MSNYFYVPDTAPEYNERRYSIKRTAEVLKLGFGNKTLFTILRESDIFDSHNHPKGKYAKMGIFEVKRVLLNNWNYHYKTYVIGDEGLHFVKKTVDEYILKNGNPNDGFILVDDT